jgi:hypothetical protein
MAAFSSSLSSYSFLSFSSFSSFFLSFFSFLFFYFLLSSGILPGPCACCSDEYFFTRPALSSLKSSKEDDKEDESPLLGFCYFLCSFNFLEASSIN